MSLIAIKSEELTAIISTFGAELQSVKNKDGREYIWEGDPNVWPDHSPVLFPIVSGLEKGEYKLDGKTYKLPVHGFAMSSEFELEFSDEKSAVFLLKSSEETKKCYPFDFEFRVLYTLSKNKLIVTYSTTNKSNRDMYYSTGAHDGFICEGGYDHFSIVFDEPETIGTYDSINGVTQETPTPLLNNERELKLTREHLMKDSYNLFDHKSRGVALRDDRTGKNVVHVAFPGFDTLLLWSRVTGEGDFICIEPWAGSQDLPWKKVDDFSKKFRIMTLKPEENQELTHIITFFD